jgi:tRNA nucleotidyltransferase/poly(A) polymerase
MPTRHNHPQRQFAAALVDKLRAAGFEAYWAGGCVRDELLGRPPKDYDIATSAEPDQIRRLFGFSRTLAIGAAFGVITVLGPREAGQVEVTTFRRDASYSDGRHPDAVEFTSPEEDASRRDFTINGLFFDPVEERVIDFVGGQADLQLGLIRAIGRAEQRFAEDKLRMLRAVRFAATFQFTIEEATLDAIRRMADQIRVVSPERIAMEMRRMLVDPQRSHAVRLLLQTGLTPVVLPEIVPGERLDRALAVIDRLNAPNFPLALAALLAESGNASAPAEVGRRWRLSNKETEITMWLIEHRDALRGAAHKPWSAVQPVLAHEGAADLVALMEAALRVGGDPLDDVDWCRRMLARPRAELDPPPLVTGDDLLRHGLRAGPIYRELLEKLRDAQLDGQVRTTKEALTLVNELLRDV